MEDLIIILLHILLHLWENNLFQAFSGEMAQVGMWDRVLSLEEIRGIANCTLDMQARSLSFP